MKRLIPLTFLAVSAVFFFQCQTEKAEEPSDVDCTGLEPSFESDIKPIITTKCSFPNACHGVGSTDNYGITYDVNNFDEFQTNALKINFLASVKHKPGYIASPECNRFAAPKLPDSSIAKIECWILAGAPNN